MPCDGSQEVNVHKDRPADQGLRVTRRWSAHGSYGESQTRDGVGPACGGGGGGGVRGFCRNAPHWSGHPVELPATPTTDHSNRIGMPAAGSNRRAATARHGGGLQGCPRWPSGSCMFPLARFSAEGSSRDSSSCPDCTWRRTRSASGSSEMLNSVSVVIITTLDPFRGAGAGGAGVLPRFRSAAGPTPASGQVSFFAAAFIAAWRFR